MNYKNAETVLWNFHSHIYILHKHIYKIHSDSTKLFLLLP